jgi:hypothetical protein
VTPEYMENQDFIIKIILSDNNKYREQRTFNFRLIIKGNPKPKPEADNNTLNITSLKPWNSLKRLSPSIQYTKVKVDMRMRTVSIDGLTTIMMTEQASEFNESINNETLRLTIDTRDQEPVNFTINSINGQ